MSARVASILAPLYLFACLLLGGSVQGIWSNLALQLAAVIILGWALTSGKRTPGKSAARLRALGLAALALIAVQLLPLPPGIWSAFPGREVVADGFNLLGGPLPWMPLTMAPERSLSFLLALLPAGAMLAMILRAPVEKPSRLAIAAVAGMLVSVVVAALQLTQGDSWYPYKIYSLGTATGLFANTNHLAALILVSIPLIAAIAADFVRSSKRDGGGNNLTMAAALAAGVAIILVGVALNKSFAILLLGGPIIAASALIVLPPKSVRLDRMGLLLVGMIAIAAAGMMAVGAERLTRLAGQASVAERQQIWSSSAKLAAEYIPFGSGLGTFEKAYHLQEDPDQVGREYINHAHNDFLEIVIELGLPGALLLIVFLAWWVARFVVIWKSGQSPPIVRAATLVSLALLAHSLVDFPLRPAALSAVFAMAVALMALPAATARRDVKGEPKHLRLEDLDW